MDVIEFERHRASVETPLGRIGYAEFGSGPAALFIHGVFMNGLLWRNLIRGLAESRRCIAIDLPAHGNTPSDESWDLTLPGLVDAVEALRQALNLGSVDMVANDTGGAVAQVYAAKYSNRIRTLTLTNTDTHENFPPEAFKAGVELATQGKLAPLMRSMVADLAIARSDAGLGLGYEHPELLSDDVVLGFLGPLVEDDARARELERFVTASDASMLLAVEDELRHLEVPTLIAWGTADVFFEIHWAHRLYDTIAGAQELVEIPGGKLFFVDERADELRPHVVRHWESVSVSS